MYYFDSAYVAKCYLNDPDSEAVRSLVRKPTELFSSSICIAEVSCAIHRRVREKGLSRRQGNELCDLFQAHIEEGIWRLLPSTDRLLWEVSHELKSFPANGFVRAGDAIHLISARREGFTEVWTNDRHMILTAPHFRLNARTA